MSRTSTIRRAASLAALATLALLLAGCSLNATKTVTVTTTVVQKAPGFAWGGWQITAPGEMRAFLRDHGNRTTFELWAAFHRPAAARIGDKAGVFPRHTTVYVNTATGSDTTCLRNIRGRPCATQAKACTLAAPSGSVYRIGQTPARVSFDKGCRVFLTAPLDGATVSGASVTVTAVCTIICAGVQFKLDGVNLQAEDTSSPYTIAWDATATTNGTHALTAVERDSRGNLRTSLAASVTVSGGAADVANVFVSTTGSDSGANCVHNATAIAPPATASTYCLTLAKAYSLAQPGEIIDMADGTYPAETLSYTAAKAAGSHCDWVSNNDIYNPAPNLSGCISVRCVAGATVYLNLRIEVPYVHVDGNANGNHLCFHFDGTASNATTTTSYCQVDTTGPANCPYSGGGFSLGGTPLTNSYNCLGDTYLGRPQEQNHDDIIQGVQGTLASFLLSGQHVAIEDSDFNFGTAFNPLTQDTSFVRDCVTNAGVTTPVQSLYMGVVHNVLHDGFYPVGSNGANCLGHWTCEHTAFIHYEGGTHVLFSRNWFLDWPGHAIEPESELGVSIGDALFENNLFDASCSHQPTPTVGGGFCVAQGSGLTMSCHSTPVTGYIVARFNTFLQNTHGTAAESWLLPTCGAGNNTNTGNADYGNVEAGGCGSLDPSFGATPDYQVIPSGSCGTHAITAAPFATYPDFTSPVASGPATSFPDIHLPSGSAAINGVPTSVTGGVPAVDICGNARTTADGFVNAGASDSSSCATG